MLDCFYAVTVNREVLEIKPRDPESPSFTVFNVNTEYELSFDHKVEGKSHLSLGKSLQLYDLKEPGNKEKRDAGSNFSLFHGQVSYPIAGYFVKRDMARYCATDESPLVMGDVRWWDKTEELFRAIGDDPLIDVSTHPFLALTPARNP